MVVRPDLNEVAILASDIRSELMKIDPEQELKDWIIKTFKKISIECSNGETIENIEIENNEQEKIILFNVDCGEYGVHSRNRITINKNEVKMSLTEIIDGGDIQYKLKRKLEEYFKNE